MGLRGIFSHQLPGFLKRKGIHAGIGKGFDVADTVIVILWSKAARASFQSDNAGCHAF